MGLTLKGPALQNFRTYYTFLSEKNQVMNLTAISGEAEVARLHFLDCLAILGQGDFSGARVIDIGSGAGFPGLPLKIAQPDIQLTLLDAQQKRVRFLEELCERLSGIGARCLHARAEEAALDLELRDSFDFALSRAVARLNVLTELCLPFVRVGGAFIAMKGPDCDEEIAEARHAVTFLGGAIENTVDYTLPGTDITHRLVIIRKTAKTPKNYPRRFPKIQKNPL